MSKGEQQKAVFDKAQTKAMIEKGRRAKWITRKGGKATGFTYYRHDGKQIRSPEMLERIKSLVIPPAWKHVRICPSPNGRLQVVGMDTLGRIQYRYHPAHTRKQERKKFKKIEDFGNFLPALKKATNADLQLDGLPKEKVLALVMRLINSLYFRVGTEHSEKHYKTFGITTLHKKHLRIGRNGKLEFEYVGKSHVQHRKIMVDPELSDIVKELTTIKRGRKLFRYIDDGGRARPIKPSDVNRYIKAATDPRFSSKDLRTWGGTLLAALELAEIGAAKDEAEIKKNLVTAIRNVAEELGNTPAVCRSSYVHPAVIDAYCKGITLDQFRPRKTRRIRRIQNDLEPEEAALLKLFENGR